MNPEESPEMAANVETETSAFPPSQNLTERPEVEGEFLFPLYLRVF